MSGPDRIEEHDVAFIRASGDCICPTCGKAYWRHPHDERVLGLEDHNGIRQPFLHVLCEGLRVKL